jgi:hypothetical protein
VAASKQNERVEFRKEVRIMDVISRCGMGGWP